MRHYETVFIADPDLPVDNQDNLFEKARTLISGNGGELIDFDEWGNKRLAYEIRKKQRGHYVRLDYCGGGDTVSSLENAFRLDERVLKFMTVLLAGEADPEQLKAALAATRETTESPEKSDGDATAAEAASAPEAATAAEPAATAETAEPVQADSAETETTDGEKD